MAVKTVLSKMTLGRPVVTSATGSIGQLGFLVRYTTACSQAFLDEHCTVAGLLNLEAKLAELSHQNAVIADEQVVGYRMRTACANSRILKMVQDRGLSVLRGYLWRYRAFPTVIEAVYATETVPATKRGVRQWRDTVETTVRDVLKTSDADAAALVRPVINYRRNHL